MDEQEAVDALVSANAGEAAPETGTEQATTTDTTSPVDTGATTQDSFVNIDQVPDELKPLAKQLQGDYTRKTQEVASFRKAAESAGMTAEDAAQALTFVQSLNDENALRALYENLSPYFGEQGGAQEQEQEFSDPRDQALAELQNKVESFEANMLRSQAEAQLDKLDAVVRSQHAEWSDEDMNTVYRLAVSNGGDLSKAADDYNGLQQRILGAHLNKKAVVPAGSNAPGATAHAEGVTRFKTTDEAHPAALRALAEALAAE